MVPSRAARAAWVRCGAAELTGDADGPPLTVPTTAALVVDGLLAPWGLDARVLTDRARLLGLRRTGTTSCGGATHLLPAADGWVAVALARPSDRDLLPAWLGSGIDVDADRAGVAGHVAHRPVADLVAGATELGLPCAAVGEVAEADPVPSARERLPDLSGRRVVDLSTLWAGPLCAHLLQRAGASVVKVEDPGRPDGARATPAFHDLVNSGKAEASMVLASRAGRDALRRRLLDADVVVTSARRRAFEQLGLAPDDVLGAADHPITWVAITAHGWSSERVGFGDDAAAAGGLVAVPPDGVPRFAADALADPLTGVVAAVRALSALEAGAAALLDCSLARTAAAFRPTGPAAP